MVMRREAGETPDRWDKMDGRYYGLGFDGRELFAPLLPATTPVGYRFASRARLPHDAAGCGRDNDFLVSHYDGTIEGAGCVDPADGTYYVGRGDGRLHPIDAERGVVKWAFTRFNPERPDDPDGDDGIVGDPLLRDGVIYFGTLGAPWPGNATDPAHETRAVYAVDRAGKLVWRYPSKKARLDNWVVTPPAFSPDGKTLYVGTFGGDKAVPGCLIATDPAHGDVRWKLVLRNDARPGKPAVYVRLLAVGPDGRIYGSGCQAQFLGASPVVFAVEPRGRLAWIAEPQDYPSRRGQFCGGIALHEKNGAVRSVLASTTHLRNLNGEGGALYALDPATGRVAAEFAPFSGVGGMTAPVVDAAGSVYVGIRGKHPAGRLAAVNGRM